MTGATHDREDDRVTATKPDRTDKVPWWRPVAIYLGIASVVWVTVYLAGRYLPREYLYARRYNPGGGPLIERWMRWDASWYREIVRHGYRYYPGVQSSVAYFPAYPLAIAAVAWAFPSIAAAGVFVTVASAVGASLLFYRWCVARMSPSHAITALVVLLVFPYSWYLYGAVYADAFFLLVVLTAFVLAERDHLWLAGLAGFVATASRPTGIAVAIGLVLVVVERRNLAATAPATVTPVATGAPTSAPGPALGDMTAAPPAATDVTATAGTSARGGLAGFGDELRRRFDPRAFSWSAAPLLLAFGGLVAWSSYLWVRFNDPLLFVHIESQWGQGAGVRTWLKFEFFYQMHLVPHSLFSAGLIFHAIAGIGALLLVPRVARRFGWAYGAYVLLVMGIPVLGTKDFMSCARYLLAAFPVFAVVGDWLAERDSPLVRNLWVGVSFVLLIGFAALWSMGKYLS